MSRVREEYERRREKERQKALEKYGQEGLLPAGNPQLDVLDYAINETVGLVRYADMIFERRTEWPPEFQARAARLAIDLAAAARNLSLELIALHQGLLSRGYLGLREGEPGT